MQARARVVVIGGGITGVSILYHLAAMGWTDVLLLERRELTCGASWHAAGNLFAITSPANVQKLQMYSFDFYGAIERETGQPIGFHPTGGLHLAASAEERLTLTIERAQARRNGLEAEFIDLAEARRRLPIIDTGRLTAVLWEPTQGHVDPSQVIFAIAAAARSRGATIHRNTPVIETSRTSGGGWRVVTPNGTIEAEFVVNAAGLWSREVAALAGITLPLMPVEHHYLVTEDIPEIAAFHGHLPAFGDNEAAMYGRQEGRGLLIGAYEDTCRHWAVDGTPVDFGHDLLPDDLSRMERNFAMAVDRVPCLASAGIKRVINGPMIFSPDLGPLIGPWPGLDTYFCACGVMTGFNQSAGIGRIIAQWIVEGEPGMDVACWDVMRFGPWAGRRYTRERTRFFYENRMDRPYPYKEYEAGRPIRTFPAYDMMKGKGAVFGESYGWEDPLWYARPGEEARDRYSFRRANWWAAVGEECRATRAGVGLFEVSTFGKYEVSGPGAAAWLDRLLAGRVPVEPGRMALSPMLSPKGRLIGDFTVTCLDAHTYLMVGSGTMQGIHMRRFRSLLPATGVSVCNRSDQWTGLMIAGPNARTLLSRVAGSDVSAGAFPLLSARRLDLEGAPQSITARVSFTGELGYEIHTPAMFQRSLFAALLDAGEGLGLRLAGAHALMNLRLEKNFPAWGLELSPDYTPLEPGLDRFVRWDKGGFIGREALLRVRDEGPAERLSGFVVDAADADCSGNEPVFRDGAVVGYTTSGGYGYCVEESLALGYVAADAFEDGAAVTIEINGERRPARLATRPRLDPDGARMRS